VLLAEKASVLDDFHRGALSGEAHDALIAAIDARLGALESGPPLPDGQEIPGAS
jgi:hypothetical protein